VCKVVATGRRNLWSNYDEICTKYYSVLITANYGNNQLKDVVMSVCCNQFHGYYYNTQHPVI